MSSADKRLQLFLRFLSWKKNCRELLVRNHLFLNVFVFDGHQLFVVVLFLEYVYIWKWWLLISIFLYPPIFFLSFKEVTELYRIKKRKRLNVSRILVTHGSGSRVFLPPPSPSLFWQLQLHERLQASSRRPCKIAHTPSPRTRLSRLPSRNRAQICHIPVYFRVAEARRLGCSAAREHPGYSLISLREGRDTWPWNFDTHIEGHLHTFYNHSLTHRMHIHILFGSPGIRVSQSAC